MFHNNNNKFLNIESRFLTEISWSNFYIFFIEFLQFFANCKHTNDYIFLRAWYCDRQFHAKKG